MATDIEFIRIAQQAQNIFGIPIAETLADLESAQSYTPPPPPPPPPAEETKPYIIDTVVNQATGDVYAVWSDGTQTLLQKGNTLQQQALAQQQAMQARADSQRQQGESAYNLLYEQFSQFGLGALVEPLKNLIVQGLGAKEYILRLRDTEAYKKRFAANAQRLAKGLSALSEAEYIRTEDAYQEVMRRYGLPESYYSRGDMGRQEGFEKLLANDISVTELEDRIQTAYNRVINGAPEVSRALREYYPEISDGDILAYALDPQQAIGNIKRKVTAAEIGAGATMAGLSTGMIRAEELAKYGVTGEQARQGYQTVADVVPRGSQLSEFYKQGPYTQTTAEQEVFGLTGAGEAAKQRKKLTQLEQATFSGQTGITSGALARDRAGAI